MDTLNLFSLIKKPQAQYYILLLIVFLMPFSRMAIPPLIIIWMLLWIISGNFKEKFTTVFRNPLEIALLLFYVLHIVGMLWTSNYLKGWFELEVKLSLFLIPLLIFGSSSFLKEKYNSILWCFVFANFVSSLICFVFIFYKSISNHLPFYSYLYSNFSLFLHPSYGSMYVLFSSCIIIYFLLTGQIPNWKKEHSSKIIWAMVTLLTFFCIVIYFYSSRAGLISSFFILALTISIFLIKRKMNNFIRIVVVIILLGILWFFVQHNPRFEIFTDFLKSYHEVNYDTQESISTRYTILIESIELIKKHYLIGVGTGDVKDVLMQQYKTKHFTFAEGKSLNVHNQYLETTLGLGLIGGIYLLMLVLLPLILGIKHRNMLGVFFSIIIMINFLFECMLNIQNGIVFFSFFYSLLMFLNNVRN